MNFLAPVCTHLFDRIRRQALPAATAATILAIALTGCGIGTLDTASSSMSGQLAPITGTAYGGGTPISGATISLWVTGSFTGGFSSPFTVTAGHAGSTGYGVATMLASTTTDANGGFSFTNNFYCPANQYVYLQSYGGNPGGGTNTAALLVSALGRCEDLYSNTSYTGSFVTINEVTTVAAAYGLGQFSQLNASGSADGSGATISFPFVGIGADSANNALKSDSSSSTYSVGNCTGSGATLSCSAAGLYHGFRNAIALASPFLTGTNGSGGWAGATGSSASNTGSINGTTYAYGVVGGLLYPTQLLNTVANYLVACVNSAGPSSTQCGYLWTAASISGSSNQVVWNFAKTLAANPTLTGSVGTAATAITNLEGLPGSNGFNFTPYVNNASPTITDFAMGIVYPAGLGATGNAACAGTCQGINFPQQGTLDINDNFYVGNQNGSTGTTGNLIAFRTGKLTSITNNSSGASSIALQSNFGPSADVNGNIYVSAGTSGSPVTSTIGKYTTTLNAAGDATIASSTPCGYSTSGGTPYNGAVDQAGNYWVAASNGTSTAFSIYYAPAGSTWCTGITAVATSSTGVTGIVPSTKVIGVAVDPNQNIWFGSGATSPANQLTIIQNQGTITAPAYGGTSGNTFPVTSAGVVTDTTIGGSSSFPASGIAFYKVGSTVTANQSFYSTAGNKGAQAVTPTYSGAKVASVALGTLYTTTSTPAFPNFSGTFYSSTDGNNIVWLAETNGKRILQWTPGSSLYKINGCATTSATSACSTIFLSSAKPQSVSVDAAGDLWVAASVTTNGSVVEFIGSATPAWPLVSYGKLGKP